MKDQSVSGSVSALSGSGWMDLVFPGERAHATQQNRAGRLCSVLFQILGPKRRKPTTAGTISVFMWPCNGVHESTFSLPSVRDGYCVSFSEKKI